MANVSSFLVTKTSEMKMNYEVCEAGNKPVKQASLIDDDKEDKLWKTNTLAADGPAKLLHTVLYLAGMKFYMSAETKRNQT